MTFMYPAVLTPYKEDVGLHVGFSDLEYCIADGPDLEDAVKNVRYAAYNWLWVEFEEGTCDSPSQSHYDDVTLEQGSFIKCIMAAVRLMPDSD